MELYEPKLISDKETIFRLTAEELKTILTVPTVVIADIPSHRLIGVGCPASGGIASGRLVLSSTPSVSSNSIVFCESPHSVNKVLFNIFIFIPFLFIQKI